MKSLVLLVGLLLAVVQDAAAQLTQAQQSQILNDHNNKRRAEGGSNIIQLQTSNDLVQLAQQHSAGCILKHRDDLESRGLGENIAACIGCDIQGLLESAAKGWYDDEKPRYDHASRTCDGTSDNWGACSHYLQIVWAATSEFGCGYTLCANLQNFGSNALFLVCNYRTRSTNFAVTSPYSVGTACSGCPPSHSACSNGLCIATQGGSSGGIGGGGSGGTGSGSCYCHSWEEWGPCSASCGVGSQTKRRNCMGPGVGINCQPTEARSCNTPCSNWTPWSQWSDCSVDCGSGTESRLRTCENGNSCIGQSFQLRSCNSGISCETWVTWSPWEPCSATCGSGTRRRTRRCLTGNNCRGESTEFTSCSAGTCPVPEWGPWGTWSSCSSSCIGALRARAKSCLRGTNCPGSPFETASCGITQACTAPQPPVTNCDTLCQNWQGWQPCSATCGENIVQIKRRQCSTTNTAITCSQTEARLCSTQSCPIVSIWNPWNDWSPCSITCGPGAGVISRSRTCQGGAFCSGDPTQSQTCQVGVTCANWGTWGAWGNCGVTCGSVFRSRARLCSNSTNTNHVGFCPGTAFETVSCGLPACPVAEWSQWVMGQCPVTCDSGFTTRTRTCLPSGTGCPGLSSERVTCHSGVNCPVATWSPWQGNCPVTCGVGIVTRTRTCMPVGGNCPGPVRETQFCNTGIACPVLGWTAWVSGSCSVTCGSGTLTRTRTCQSTAANCPGQPSETINCNTAIACPLLGWTDWVFSACSVSCGVGTSTGTRTCQSTAANCPGVSSRQFSCDTTVTCPSVNCEQVGVCTAWSNWSACTFVNVGGVTRSVRTRNRTCSNQLCTTGETRLCLGGAQG